MKDAIFGMACGLVSGAAVVFIIFSATDERTLKACAREHNIYACEFIAVPKQPDEDRK